MNTAPNGMKKHSCTMTPKPEHRGAVVGEQRLLGGAVHAPGLERAGHQLTGEQAAGDGHAEDRARGSAR